MQEASQSVGHEVGKVQPRVTSAPIGAVWQVPNDDPEIADLLGRLRSISPAAIVRDAAGGRERFVADALWRAGLPVVVVNPHPERDVARSTSQAPHERR